MAYMELPVNKKLTAKTVNALPATGKGYSVWDTEIKGINVRVTVKRVYLLRDKLGKLVPEK